MTVDAEQIKIMNLRYAGTCGCGRQLSAGTRAGYDKVNRRVICLTCLDADAPTAEPSTAALMESKQSFLDEPAIPQPDSPRSSSLERAYEHRKAAREADVRAKHPRIGGFLLAITDEPASTRAFRTGAEGEAKAAQQIFGRVDDNVMFLTNRKLGIGRRDGDIDMIAITAAGIYVIDVKNYKDAPVEVRTTGGLFSPRISQLYVGGRDKTAWLTSMAKQHDAIRTALVSAPELSDVPVHQVLCFVDAALPLLTRLTIRHVSIYSSRQLGRNLKSLNGPYDASFREATHGALAKGLPPA